MPPLEVPARLDRSEGDVHPRRQSAHPSRPAQHRPRRDGAGDAAGRDRSRRTRRSTRARCRRFEARWSAAIAQLGARGRAAQGRGRGRAPQELHLPAGTGSGCARSATLEPKPGVEPSAGAPGRSCCAQLQRAAGADGAARRLPGRARLAVAGRAREGPGRGAAVHRRRQRPARRTCSVCSTTRIARLLGAHRAARRQAPSRGQQRS